MYEIHGMPLRQQLRHRYRVGFFSVLADRVALACGLPRQFARVPTGSAAVLIGAYAGRLPSLWQGTPACMSVTASDLPRIDAWLARRHVRDARGWGPRLPRMLYFDSQIVRYGAGCAGPRITLRSSAACCWRSCNTRRRAWRTRMWRIGCTQETGLAPPGPSPRPCLLT